MFRLVPLTVFAFVGLGCATSRPAGAALEPMTFEATPLAAQPLEENHFVRDRSVVGEAQLRAILAAPVFLEDGARVGVLPVASRYEVDEGLWTQLGAAELVSALERSGLVELATEVSSEWPRERGLPGLRELAARYRSEYLLLLRQRFVERTHPTVAALSYVTLVAALFVPGTRVETTGVLEATLFDVKTGTVLFTVNERVQGETLSTPLAVPAVSARQQQALVAAGLERLSDTVLSRMRRLVASRPGSTPVSAVGGPAVD